MLPSASDLARGIELKWKTRLEYSTAGRNPCTSIQSPRTYSLLAQGLARLILLWTDVYIGRHHITFSPRQSFDARNRPTDKGLRTCADCSTFYTMWHMCWRNLLLELQVLFLSTTYSVLGSSEPVPGAAALLERSFKIPGPGFCFRGSKCDILGTGTLWIDVQACGPSGLFLLREDWSPDLS